MEFLKALFGTTADGNPEALTYDQLAEKVTAGKLKVVNLDTDPQLMGALGAAEYARQKGLAKK